MMLLGTLVFTTPSGRHETSCVECLTDTKKRIDISFSDTQDVSCERDEPTFILFVVDLLIMMTPFSTAV